MAESLSGSTGADIGSRNVALGAVATTTGSDGDDGGGLSAVQQPQSPPGTLVVMAARGKRDRDLEGTEGVDPSTSAPEPKDIVPPTAGGSHSGNAEALCDATEPVWMVPKYFKREGGGDRPLDKQPNHMLPAVRQSLFALVSQYGWEGAKTFAAFLGVCMARKLIVRCDSSLEPCSVAKFSSELALMHRPLQYDAFLGTAKAIMTQLKEFVAADPHGNEVDGDGRLVMKDDVLGGGPDEDTIQFLNVCVSSRHTDVVHQILRHVKLTSRQAGVCFSLAMVRPKDFEGTTKDPDPPVTTMQEELMGLVDPVRQLEIAIRLHHVEFVRKFGTDTINDRSSWRSPLLHLAVLYRNLSMVELLLEKGVDVHARDNGRTALHVAVFYQNELIATRMAMLVMEKGVDVDARNNRGSTALHLAAFCQKARMVKVLVEKGANVHARDNYGKTSLMKAKDRANPNQEIIALLTAAERSRRTLKS